MSRRWRKNESDRTHYEVLGVRSNCSQDEIKRAFVELSKEHHPDMPGGDTEVSKRINVAYTVLSRPDERKKYDSQLQTTTWKPNPVDDQFKTRPATFEEISRMFGFSKQGNVSSTGRNILTVFGLFILSGLSTFFLMSRGRRKPIDETGNDEGGNRRAGGDFVARRAARQHHLIRERTRAHGTFEKQLSFVEGIVRRNSEPPMKTDPGKNG